MLSRVIIKNLFSFKEQVEFNTFPSKATRLKHHKRQVGEVELLKLSALYGANGAGKSNLIRAVSLLKNFVTEGTLPRRLSTQYFRLSPSCKEEPTEIGIEFFYKEEFFFYSIGVKDLRVVYENLSLIVPNSDVQTLLFERKLLEKETYIKLLTEETEDEKAEETKRVFEELLAKDLLKTNKSLLQLLSTTKHFTPNKILDAYEWISEKLTILYPNTKANALPVRLDEDANLSRFATEILSTFHLGVESYKIEKAPLEELLGSKNSKQIEEIKASLTDNDSDHLLGEITNQDTGEKAFAVNEGGQIFTKRLVFEQPDDSGNIINFTSKEISDGTRRLIDYIPALNSIINTECTYLIDEMERSIHVLLIKEIIAKFSADANTKGQLIFSTHECNLLDQDILRTDEIWFAEKDQLGSTQLYPLSDFKEHSTIDIRKGYLNGRYGAIPFAGNLKDLNWNHADQE